MSEHIYCVYATTYSGPTELPFIYIGSSTVEKIKAGYKGSVSSRKWSKLWKQEIKDHPEYFLVRILICYASREEALQFELELQKELEVIKHPMCINESYAQVNGCFGRDVSGENNPMFGLTKENSEIVRIKSEKISTAQKEYYKNNSSPNLGKPGWNIGLSKEINEGVAKQAEKIKQLYNSDSGRISLEKGRLTRAQKDKEDPSRIERRKQKQKEAGLKRRKLSEEEQTQIIEWHLQGISCKKIVKLLNYKVSENPIGTIIKNYQKSIQGESYDSTNTS
jgi:hypothetical protein